MAHIGVIQWLVENGYAIRSISGSSMGALVGGIYATGKLEVYADWVRSLERRHVVRLLDPAIGRPGLFKGERIVSELEELIGDHTIEELPISFTAVATDLQSGEEVWLRKGKLFDAIRASMATPLVFTPWIIDGRTLLDGAIVNPVPIAPTLEDGTDLTIAVGLSGRPEPRAVPSAGSSLADGDSYRKRMRDFIDRVRPFRASGKPSPGIINVALASMQAMQDTIAKLRMSAAPPHIFVAVPRNACGFFEFWRAEELIALGRERTAQAFARAEEQPLRIV